MLLSMGLWAWSAAAQEPPTEKPPAETKSEPKADRAVQMQKRFADMQARMKLTPEQQTQVRPIILDELQKLKAVRDDMQAGSQRPRDRMQAGRKMRAIESDTEAKLKPILSTEQMEEYKKMREERRAQVRAAK